MRDKAIRTIHPTVTTINAGTEASDKDGNVVELDESKIAVEVARLQAEYDALAYSRSRADSYPSIQDVTIALAEKAEGNSAMWDTITAQRLDVKSRFPKPE
tara:strand:+ start:553 stop:855 length:303 start_codon:yes stop_codon:yes gene_type:complete